MTENKRWKHRPTGSNWGDFGPDDQCGRMNLLTPQKVLQGLAEAREGLTFNLSLPLDFPGGNVLNPRRMPPVLRPTLRNGKPNINYEMWCDDANCTDVLSDDLVIMHLQYSTQWDSLAHVGSMFDANGDGKLEPVYYNGFRAGIDVVGPSKADGAGIFDFLKIPRESTSQAKALGIDKMSERCVQGRAVMIDLLDTDLILLHDVHQHVVVDIHPLAPHVCVQVDHDGTALNAALGHLVNSKRLGL